MKAFGLYALSSLLCLVASTPLPDTLHSSTRQAGRPSANHERSQTLRRRQTRSGPDVKSSSDGIKSRPMVELTAEEMAAKPPSRKAAANRVNAYRLARGRTPPSPVRLLPVSYQRGSGRRDPGGFFGFTSSRLFRRNIQKRDVPGSVEGLPVIDLPQSRQSQRQLRSAQEWQGESGQPQTDLYQEVGGSSTAEAGDGSSQLVQTKNVELAREQRASGVNRGAVTSFNFENISQSKPTACNRLQFLPKDMWVALSSRYMGRRAFDNPLCHRQVVISYGGRQVGAWVADKCPGCVSRSRIPLLPSSAPPPPPPPPPPPACR